MARFLSASAVAGLLSVAAPSGVGAETLVDALASAYATNPVLNSERAALRGTDENVPRARSGFRPRVSAGADVQRQFTETRSRLPGGGTTTSSDSRTPRGYSVQLTQNIFQGMQNVNAVREAEANVSSGREALRAVEQAVFLEAVTAYMDVVRDQAIVRLQENNVKVLSEQLGAVRDRFDVGEVTRTDVAQAEAAQAGAVSSLNLAQANLQTSRSVYERVIGHPPAGLRDEGPIERLLPASLDEALYIGDSENPNVLAAVFLEQASAFTVKRITGELLPHVTFEATRSERFDTSSSVEASESTTFVGRVNVPLYQGGEVAARVRQAKDFNLQRRRDIDQARVVVRADVVSAWGLLAATRAQLQSDQTQVEASRIALAGVREEEQVGQRTVLDVLDAEQSLLNAEVSRVATRRDMVVASYTLVQAVGRLDALTLGLPVEYYDPLAHYERVKGKWWGLNAEPEPHGLHAPR